MKNWAGRAAPFCLLLFFWGLALPSVLRGADRLEASIDRLAGNGGVGLMAEERLLYGRNLDLPLVPASILKIVTALGGISILGEDFRFRTAFYLDQEENLVIRGFGDPFLVSEEIDLVVKRLRARGLIRVRDIILDKSAFAINGPPVGANGSDNPYDAENSALAVNFNTVNIRIARDGSVSSAEPQTPDLPIMGDLAAGLDPGRHRINISRRDVRLAVDPVLTHVGQLFWAILRQHGVPVSGKIRPGRVEKAPPPFYVHRSSRTLKEMLAPLLLYSNNFIANQLFLACGAEKYGYPATWEKGRAALQAFLASEFGFDKSQVYMAEGSGLSRENRLTPRTMLAVLDRFRPYRHFLPVVGNRLVKSGTLTGVYSYAGYLEKDGRPGSFVIILNQQANQRDRILGLLEQLAGAR